MPRKPHLCVSCGIRGITRRTNRLFTLGLFCPPPVTLLEDLWHAGCCDSESLGWSPPWHRTHLLCSQSGMTDKEVSSIWKGDAPFSPGDEGVAFYTLLLGCLKDRWKVPVLTGCRSSTTQPDRDKGHNGLLQMGLIARGLMKKKTIVAWVRIMRLQFYPMTLGGIHRRLKELGS